MATPKELKKKSEQIQISKELADKKRLDIINTAHEINGHDPISEKEYKGKTESIFTKEQEKIFNHIVESKPNVVEYKYEDEVILNVDDLTDQATKKQSIYEKQLDLLTKAYKIHTSKFAVSGETEPLPSYANTSMFKKEEDEVVTEKSIYDWAYKRKPVHLEEIGESEPEIALTSDYVETKFKFTVAERNFRIKEDPNFPKNEKRKEGESSVDFYDRLTKEQDIRRKFIEQKTKELNELEEKINKVMYPIEIVVTDENEEFCINAFELADNLAMTELEKDSTFSLDENTELYNKTYDKYMKLISSFKLDKNA